MSGHRNHHRRDEVARLRNRAKRKILTAVNTCAKCGEPMEPEMVAVGSQFCATCIIDECRRCGDWEE